MKLLFVFMTTEASDGTKFVVPTVLAPKVEINCRVHCCQTLSSIHIEMIKIHILAPFLQYLFE